MKALEQFAELIAAAEQGQLPDAPIPLAPGHTVDDPNRYVCQAARRIERAAQEIRNLRAIQAALTERGEG